MIQALGFVLAVTLSFTPLRATDPAPNLRLCKRIPLSEVVNDKGESLKPDRIAHSDPPLALASTTPTEGYGFIQGGKAFTPGWGGWVYELEKGTWTRAFPASLNGVSISRDGTLLHGSIRKSPEAISDSSYSMNTLTGKPDVSYAMMHPDNAASVDINWGITTNAWIEEISIDGVKVPLKGRYFASVDGFTDDGNYLLVDKGRYRIDTRRMKMLPPDPELDEVDTNVKNYIGDSSVFVYNRDASWVAGTKLEYDGFTFLWNRQSRQFVWKSTQVAFPSAFSPNDAYLLCEGAIVRSMTGTIVFPNLQGKRGKFSPDGRSLVTVDDEAFYIYTLPKDSEPIFGVFQKPKPWSPPKAKVKGKGKTR